MKGSQLLISNNKNTRPLKDLVRESIFNLIAHTNKISFKFNKSTILDLYAGTGSFGLECLSRNAEKVFFIENEKNILKILKKNLKKFNLEKKVNIFPTDVFNFIEKKSELISKIVLVFCDPPFKNNNIDKLIELIYQKNILKKNGIIIIHRNKSSIDKI